MAKTHGNSGTVSVAAGAVAEVTDFEYSDDCDIAEGGAMGGTNKSYGAGLIGGGGTITCNWDRSDQSALVTGASVALILTPAGSGAAYTGTVVIASCSVSSTYSDYVKASFTFKGVLAQ